MKIHDIVDELLIDYPKGEMFFDKFDEVIRMPENVDILQELFNQIYREYKTFNIVVSGKFGDWVKYLIKKGYLRVPGNVLHVSGSLRGKGTFQGGIKLGKEIEVISKKYDIDNQKFIFFDDSFYSGSTKKAIEDFLKKQNSSLVKTFVIYDGKEQKETNRSALYRYYDNKKEKIIPVLKLYNILDKVKNITDVDTKVISDKIATGEIRTERDLYSNIDREKLYNLTYRYENRRIKNFGSFLKD